MNSIFITGGVISVVYLIFKFLEMRFILKEKKPMKVLFRDTLIVYISVVLGWTIFSQFNSDVSKASTPEVFTNDPNF